MRSLCIDQTDMMSLKSSRMLEAVRPAGRAACHGAARHCERSRVLSAPRTARPASRSYENEGKVCASRVSNAGLCACAFLASSFRKLLYSFHILLLAGLFCAITGCEEDSTLQDRILAESAIDELSDKVYLFPANNESNSPAVYLPIRKWDLLFFGDVQPGETVPDPEISNLFIPGRYNHMMAYVGKDADGYAYAAELNISNIRLVNDSIATDGHISLLCIGTDYDSDTHPSGRYTNDRNHYRIRSAKAFIPSIHEQLMLHDDEMVQRLMADLRAQYPYQLQLAVSLTAVLAGKRDLQLVDDGFAGGSSCAEYWVELFETYAKVCIKNSRMDAADLLAYFRNSPEGRAAYLPARYNPLGTGNVPIGQMIANGVFIIHNPPPHIYACDGTKETGIVIGDPVMRSPLLVDPAY